EKPKKIRRRWPCANGAQFDAAVVVAANVLAPATCAEKMPLGWASAAASVGPFTTTWVLVICRGPDWLNCTLARSTAGHRSPEPMVSPTILRVAEAPPCGVATIRPCELR